jgi:hypothetical protein
MTEFDAMRAKTERLRALRLARDAEQTSASVAIPNNTKKARIAGRAKTKPEPLSKWLTNRSDSGQAT